MQTRIIHCTEYRYFVNAKFKYNYIIEAIQPSNAQFYTVKRRYKNDEI